MTAAGTGSWLYAGRVMHARLQPFHHRFTYRTFTLLLDLAELEALDGRLRLFSLDRFNLLSFFQRDHGPRDGSCLRRWVVEQMAEHGLGWQPGRIRLLCYPRLLGYVFNPLSVYFIDDAAGRLRAILYDVRNTFGDKHGYLIEVPADHPPEAPVMQRCGKSFHVSPFMPPDGEYRFRLSPPDKKLSVLIRLYREGVEQLVACQTGTRQPLTDRILFLNYIRHPLMTVKVMAAIHWEAWRIWRKGAPFHRRPAPPARPVSFIAPAPEGPAVSGKTRR